MNWTLRTPVALLVFNRPENIRRIVAQVLKARPPRVLVFGDAPRPDHPEDTELVGLTRKVISDAPWECEVLTNYAEENLGTKYRPATGLDWVFDNVEQAIFFEDDCMPHPSFFRFCDELLEKYRANERVMMISGGNFSGRRKLSPDSYVFCNFAAIWGWATWRRAWRHYDVNLEKWKHFRDTDFLKNALDDDVAEIELWRFFFDRVVSGESRTWDHQWQFACWLQNGLSIMPCVNLVRNIGFGPDAQHYVEVDPRMANLPTREMKFPLRHPHVVERNQAADESIIALHSMPPRSRDLVSRVARRVRRFGRLLT